MRQGLLVDRNDLYICINVNLYINILVYVQNNDAFTYTNKNKH
jgi:hypothetical protein